MKQTIMKISKWMVVMAVLSAPVLVMAGDSKISIRCQGSRKGSCSQEQLKKWLDKTGCHISNVKGQDNDKNAEGYYTSTLEATSSDCWQIKKNEDCGRGTTANVKFGTIICKKN